jgi:hypothetical protein
MVAGANQRKSAAPRGGVNVTAVDPRPNLARSARPGTGTRRHRSRLLSGVGRCRDGTQFAAVAAGGENARRWRSWATVTAYSRCRTDSSAPNEPPVSSVD